MLPSAILALSFLPCCGCETISDPLTTAAPGKVTAPTHRLTDQHRMRFQSQGDPDSFRWLLENRISAGMSVPTVNATLGQEGERIVNDRWIKDSGGRYRESDRVFRWGPDSNGRSVYLVFRDQRLMLPRDGLVWE